MRLLLLLALLPACAGQGADPVLEALNRIRAEGRACGGIYHPAAPPLAWDARLTAAARAHTEDMAAHGFLGHVGTDGSTVRERVEREGYLWSALGENVAYGPAQAEAALRAWAESPGHCANLMDPRFVHAGLWGREGYWTLVLGRPGP